MVVTGRSYPNNQDRISALENLEKLGCSGHLVMSANRVYSQASTSTSRYLTGQVIVRLMTQRYRALSSHLISTPVEVLLSANFLPRKGLFTSRSRRDQSTVYLNSSCKTHASHFGTNNRPKHFPSEFQLLAVLESCGLRIKLPSPATGHGSMRGCVESRYHPKPPAILSRFLLAEYYSYPVVTNTFCTML